MNAYLLPLTFQLFQLGVDLIIWSYFDVLASEILSYGRHTVCVSVDCKSVLRLDLPWVEECISEEDGVVRDVRPAQVSKPTDIVEGRDQKSVKVLILDLRGDRLLLVPRGHSSELKIQSMDRVCGTSWSLISPDRIDEVRYTFHYETGVFEEFLACLEAGSRVLCVVDANELPLRE